MAQFKFDDQITEATRLDSSICIPRGPRPRRARSSRALNDSTTIHRSESNRSQSVSCLTSPRKPSTPLRRCRTPVRFETDACKSIRWTHDRFIPNRSTTDMENAHHELRLRDEDNEGSVEDKNKRNVLGKFLRPNGPADTRILSFKAKAPVVSCKVQYPGSLTNGLKPPKIRQIPSKAEKVLDAPYLDDDFYLHLLDWSSSNQLAVALRTSVFVWNGNDASISQLLEQENEDNDVTTMAWIPEGNILSVGTFLGEVDLWDAKASKKMRNMTGHSDRVTTVAWNEHIVSSGARSGRIHFHDVRIARHHVKTLQGHSMDVCGMSWSPDLRHLATGGSDNQVLIWDPRYANRPVLRFCQHNSAVKAVSWCPWQSSLLATGGGRLEKTIRIWNTNTGTCLRTVDSGSQVSDILWNSEYKELVSGQGFPQNQLSIWQYPKLTKLGDVQGHSSRILSLCSSPDGTTVASASADETIRLWKLWPRVKSPTTAGQTQGTTLAMNRLKIR